MKKSFANSDRLKAYFLTGVLVVLFLLAGVNYSDDSVRLSPSFTDEEKKIITESFAGYVANWHYSWLPQLEFDYPYSDDGANPGGINGPMERNRSEERLREDYLVANSPTHSYGYYEEEYQDVRCKDPENPSEYLKNPEGVNYTTGETYSLGAPKAIKKISYEARNVGFTQFPPNDGSPYLTPDPSDTIYTLNRGIEYWPIDEEGCFGGVKRVYSTATNSIDRQDSENRDGQYIQVYTVFKELDINLRGSIEYMKIGYLDEEFAGERTYHANFSYEYDLRNVTYEIDGENITTFGLHFISGIEQVFSVVNGGSRDFAGTPEDTSDDIYINESFVEIYTRNLGLDQVLINESYPSENVPLLSNLGHFFGPYRNPNTYYVNL